jgi:hypothetical protein
MGVLPLLPHLVFDYRTFTLRLREWHMGEPDSGLSKHTVPGHARNRAASLLGLTVEAETAPDLVI